MSRHLPSLDDLILVRLLPRSGRPTAVQIARDLAPLLRDDDDLDERGVLGSVARLRAEGAIAARRLAATDRGRSRALQVLGLDALPPRWGWTTLRDRALPCQALGLPPEDERSAKVVASVDLLSARLLQRRFALPAPAGDGMSQALEALVCRELGHPTCATLEELVSAVISAKIGADSSMSAGTLRRLAPRVLLDLPGDLESLRERAVADWVGALPSAPEPDTAFTILEAARACPTGRFGRDKVLVHHVWRAIDGRPTVPRDLDGFKRLLVRLNGQGRVTLARADLVQLMDPDELARSEIRVGHATFHFVRAGALP